MFIRPESLVKMKTVWAEVVPSPCGEEGTKDRPQRTSQPLPLQRRSWAPGRDSCCPRSTQQVTGLGLPPGSLSAPPPSLQDAALLGGFPIWSSWRIEKSPEREGPSPLTCLWNSAKSLPQQTNCSSYWTHLISIRPSPLESSSAKQG